MEIPDHLILRYFELATDEHPDRITELREQMENGRNPRDCKLELAEIISELYHGREEAARAKEYFQTVFQKGLIPENMDIIKVSAECKSLMDISPYLIEVGIVPSRSELRRLVQQGGVQINQERILDLDQSVIEDNAVLRIGKKKFVRVIF